MQTITVTLSAFPEYETIISVSFPWTNKFCFYVVVFFTTSKYTKFKVGYATAILVPIIVLRVRM